MNKPKKRSSKKKDTKTSKYMSDTLSMQSSFEGIRNRKNKSDLEGSNNLMDQCPQRHDKEKAKPGIFSNISFSWISGIIQKANEGGLFVKNLNNISSTEDLVKEKTKFQFEFNKIQKSQRKIKLDSFIISRSIKSLTTCICISLLSMVLTFTTPLFFIFLLSGIVYIQNYGGEHKDTDSSRVTLLLIILAYLILQIIGYFAQGQVNSLKRKVSTITQNILIVLINEK